MARKRKTEGKDSEKEKPAPPPAVRKSNRQRTKKQLEEQKFNGDVVSTVINNSDDSKQSADSDNSQEPTKKANSVPKKVGRPRKIVVEKEKSAAESASDQGENSVDQNDLNVDALQVEKLEITDNNVNEVVWSEDVIEETIICEEMEIDAEVTDSTSVRQEENMMVEEVLIVNDPNFDDKDIVEYTVIETEDLGQSLAMVSNQPVESAISINKNHENTINPETIEQSSCPFIPLIESAESERQAKSTTDSLSKDSSESVKPTSRGRGRPRTVNKDQSVSQSTVNKKSEKSSKKIDVDVKEKSIRQRKNDSVVSATTVDTNNTQSSLLPLTNTVLQEDDNSSSMSERAESQETSDASTTDSCRDNKFVNSSSTVEEKIICNSLDNNKSVISTTEPSKHVLIGGEEHSRDSEMDTKVDTEDAKISSSSENSNDTFLLSSSFKNSDPSTDSKNLTNKSNEVDKKSGFRSRSGSTDTTESENSSSGVRRSNRIRTIGLMKPRSRGRGLVTKPSSESSKISVQREEQDKIMLNVHSSLEKSQKKNNSDNSSETSQSDKENSSNKTLPPQDILMPLPSINNTTAGYDSDSNKPVKVKSRWRRSSELEMSNSEAWALNQAHLSVSTSMGVQGFSTNINTQLVNEIKPQSVSTGLHLEIKQEIQDTAIPSSQNINNSMDTSGISNMVINYPLINENPSTAAVSETIGAKISLPMIPAIADREMEERLSQFEHLKENLYLTERYTNKETKRMLCDCFLTEEEFERGELGCGEDCLNRLLMIECGSRCVVGNRCTNKRFQNSEYANCEVFRTEKKGFGLRAKSSLDAGDFIMEYVGEVVNPKDFRKRAKEYSKDKNRHYYFMALKSDQIIDATMKGNISRFINHSCDPNAETQKWTVNGELRIGFFIKKFVAAGEEITFDYHFQRYGKEAQKCFCEAINCRGWIGDNPEDSREKAEFVDDLEDDEDETEDEEEEDKEQEENKEDSKENKEKKPRRQVRRKKTEKKVSDHMEDEDLEEQIEKLCATGLKNRAHTLTLSRLMVRSREIQHRKRLLKVIQRGEQPCRRLFLDYHGLRLMWSYMMDVVGSDSEDVQNFRLEVLKTLSLLPIPNKTMLIDSKVLSIIEKWSKQHYNSPMSGNSPDDDQSKLKSGNDESTASPMETDNEKSQSESANDSSLNDVKKPVEIKSEIKVEVIEQSLISKLASDLLASWLNLKEVFRIPKKERIEQMKEHEREADRGYKEKVEKEVREGTFYDRYRIDRYSSRSDSEKRSRRGRDSPDFEHSRSKDKRGLDERPNLVPMQRMSKFERRQLFALKVAKEEEARQRRQHEDVWQQHEAQCTALGLDPYTTAAFDPQTGYPIFFNPQLSQWQAIPCQVPEGATPEVIASMFAGASTVTGGTELVYSAGYDPTAAAAATTTSTTTTTATTVTLQMQNGPTIAPTVQQQQPSSQPEPEQPALESLPPPPLDLPPKWKWARDKKGRLYYYHVKERIPQWLPPPPDHIAVQPESSDTSESSDESSTSNDEDEEAEPQLGTPEQQLGELMEVDMEIKVEQSAPPEPKKRRDGLVQERIISPRREEDRIDHKKIKEIKDKLRRQKERAKIKEQVEKMKKMRRSSKSKSYSKHATIAPDMSPTTERKIKDAFRISMAEVMVHFLNPYRKNDCKQGRITNTEDFKHLARKLTHFVLAKELKHCKSVDELECNDNVKHKAKDFVRKYMSKFGAVYQKTDED